MKAETSTHGTAESAPSIHDIEASIALVELPPADLDDRSLFVERVLPASVTLERYARADYEPLASMTRSATGRRREVRRGFGHDHAAGERRLAGEAADLLPGRLRAREVLVARVTVSGAMRGSRPRSPFHGRFTSRAPARRSGNIRSRRWPSRSEDWIARFRGPVTSFAGPRISALPRSNWPAVEVGRSCTQ